MPLDQQLYYRYLDDSNLAFDLEFNIGVLFSHDDGHAVNLALLLALLSNFGPVSVLRCPRRNVLSISGERNTQSRYS